MLKIYIKLDRICEVSESYTPTPVQLPRAAYLRAAGRQLPPELRRHMFRGLGRADTGVAVTGPGGPQPPQSAPQPRTPRP